jgi:hypothetical protein
MHETRRDTLQELFELLGRATKDGALDELAYYVHPDIVNQFCDAVADALKEGE